MGKKRADGTGGLYRDYGRDRWVGDVVLDGKRHRVTAKYKTDAATKLNALIRDHDARIGDQRTTVGDLLALWDTRTLAGRDLSPSTLTAYRWAIDLLDAELADTPVARLDVSAVEDALDRLADGSQGRPLGRRSLKQVRSTLAQALDLAIRRRIVDTNVARIAELSATAKRPSARIALDPDQASQLWDALDGEPLGALFRLQLLTGLRPGEAAGVLWDDLDPDARTLTVRHAVRVVKNRAVLVDELKTATSYRTLGLPSPAIDVLAEQRRAVAALRLAATDWADDAGRLVFPTSTGRPQDPANARRELARICTAAGLPVVRPNELRHTAATVLVDQGVPVELVADLLGHANLRMLAEHYRHRVRPSVDAAVGVLDRIAGQ